MYAKSSKRLTFGRKITKKNLGIGKCPVDKMMKESRHDGNIRRRAKYSFLVFVPRGSEKHVPSVDYLKLWPQG